MNHGINTTMAHRLYVSFFVKHFVFRPVNSQGQSQRLGGLRDHKRDFHRDSSHDRSKHGGDWGRQSNRRDQHDRKFSDSKIVSKKLLE